MLGSETMRQVGWNIRAPRDTVGVERSALNESEDDHGRNGSGQPR